MRKSRRCGCSCSPRSPSGWRRSPPPAEATRRRRSRLPRRRPSRRSRPRSRPRRSEPADTGAAEAPAEEPAGEAPTGDPILIGLSTAQTGILAPYDLQASQLFEMRIEQINDEGGVLGRPLETQWIDTKSDQPQAATNAEELIGNGAVVIIATCDFDFSFPAIQAAGSAEVPGIALCASSPEGRDAGHRRAVRRFRWASARTSRASRWPSGSTRTGRS